MRRWPKLRYLTVLLISVLSVSQANVPCLCRVSAGTQQAISHYSQTSRGTIARGAVAAEDCHCLEYSTVTVTPSRDSDRRSSQSDSIPTPPIPVHQRFELFSAEQGSLVRFPLGRAGFGTLPGQHLYLATLRVRV